MTTAQSAVDERDELRLISGEQTLTRWTATSLARTVEPSKNAMDRVRHAERSKREGWDQVVTRGRVRLQLTTQRFVVIVPQEYANYDGGGRAAEVRPTAADRIKLRLIRKVGSKVAPRIVDELLGDVAPQVEVFDLANVAAVEAEGNRCLLRYEVVKHVLGDRRRTEHTVELVSGDATAIVERTGDAVMRRWLAAGLDASLHRLVEETRVERANGRVSYRPALFLPQGSRELVVVGQPDTRPPAPSRLAAPQPPARPAATAGGWACAACGHAGNSKDQDRCLRCRRARSSSRTTG